MIKSTVNGHASQKRKLIRIAMALLIMTLVSIPGFTVIGNAEADTAGSNITCGHDSICNTIAGRDFNLILFSSLGSEMVVLYSRDTIEPVVANVSEKYYSKATGNVKDAIYYLSRHPDYSGFKFRQARKSTGFFSSTVVNGVYVAVPEYWSSSDHMPPEYRFSDKNGKLRVHITPMIRAMDN